MSADSRKRQREEPQFLASGNSQVFVKRNREESIRSGAAAETLFCGFDPCRFPDCVRKHADWKKFRICRFYNSHSGCDRHGCPFKHQRPTQEQLLKPHVVRIPPPILRPSLPSPPPPPHPSPPPVLEQSLPSPPPPPLPSVQLLPAQQVDDVDTELEDDGDDTSTVPDEDTLKKIEEKEAARVAAIFQAQEDKKREEAIIAAQEAKEAEERAAERQRQKERDQARGIFSYSDLFGPGVKFERN